MRGRLVLGCLVAVVILSAVAVIRHFLVGDEKGGQTRRLADGRTVTLEAVSYGKQHHFTYGSPLSRWLQFHLPSLARLLRADVSWEGGSSSSEESLQVWLTVRNRAGRFEEAAWDRFEIIDEHGCVLPMRGRGSGSGLNFYVVHPSTWIFPRRGPSFRLLAYLRGLDVPVEFEVENPVGRDFPDWEAEPLPVSRVVEDFTFTLTQFDIRSDTNGVPVPRPVFEVRRGGVLQTDWTSPAIQYADATGNLGLMLCTNEPVWGMNVQFLPDWDTSFPATNLWSMANLAIPEPGQMRTLDLPIVVAGMSGTLLGVVGPGHYTFTGGLLKSASPFVSGDQEKARASMDDSGNRSLTCSSACPLLLFDPPPSESGQEWFLRWSDAMGRRYRLRELLGQPGFRLYRLEEAEGLAAVDLEAVVRRRYRAKYTVASPSLPRAGEEK